MTVLALADLHDAAAQASVQSTLMLDEFGAVIKMASSRAVAILQRGRSHGGQVIVVAQSVADPEAFSGQPGLLPSLTDNFSGVVAHRQTAPESRDWLAKLMGTRALWQSANQTSGHGSQHSGRGSARRVREFRIGSDPFAELGRGEAVIYTTLGPDPRRATIIQSSSTSTSQSGSARDHATPARYWCTLTELASDRLQRQRRGRRHGSRSRKWEGTMRRGPALGPNRSARHGRDARRSARRLIDEARQSRARMPEQGHAMPQRPHPATPSQRVNSTEPRGRGTREGLLSERRGRREAGGAEPIAIPGTSGGGAHLTIRPPGTCAGAPRPATRRHQRARGTQPQARPATSPTGPRPIQRSRCQSAPTTPRVQGVSSRV
jgi:hypothetical protein